jgi:excinuclease UvrABC helicase subunit UvrB
MSLFDELFNGGRRNDEDFSRFLNEMMRRYEGLMDDSMRRNDFPFDFNRQRGNDWIRQSGESQDGSMSWNSFTRHSNGEKLSESELNEMLNSMFNPNGRIYNQGQYQPTISDEQKLIMLKEDLEDSIEEEEFEKAAKIRDLIIELENK